MENQEVERYGTRTSWARELGVPFDTVSERLQEVRGISGLSSAGNVIIHGFYSESVIRDLCFDLLSKQPLIADKHGFFVTEKNGAIVKYGTKRTWADYFRCSPLIVARALEGVKGLSGRSSAGNLLIDAFYSKEDVTSGLADFLRLPKADKDGFVRFQEEDEVYGSVHAWVKKFNTNGASQIKSRLSPSEGKTAKDARGRVCENAFYTESQFRNVCGIKIFERDECNLYSCEGEKYGTIRAWSKFLRVNWRKINKIVKNAPVDFDQYNDEMLRKGYYPESFIKIVCADLLSTKQSDGK